MKNTSLFALLTGALFVFAACGPQSEPKKEESSSEAPKTCVYGYDAASTKMSWTAYKFVEKVGVKGSFDSVYIDGVSEKGSISELFGKASFRIPVSTLNTANPERDAKIKKFFFGTLANSNELSGKVLFIKGDEQTGTMTCRLNMNGQEHSTDMSYFMSGDTLVVKGAIDVGQWGAAPGIIKLNKECAVLHTGPDGKNSVLWPTLDLEIRTLLSKTCD